MSNLAGGCLMCTAGPGEPCEQACPSRTAKPRPATPQHVTSAPDPGDRCELTDLLVDQCYHCRYALKPPPETSTPGE